MNKMDYITVYLYLGHFLNITRGEERQRLRTFRVLIRPLPGLHGLPTRSYIKCGLLTYPCGLLSVWIPDKDTGELVTVFVTVVLCTDLVFTALFCLHLSLFLSPPSELFFWYVCVFIFICLSSLSIMYFEYDFNNK